MNINIQVTIGDRSGRWGSIENQGDASVSFDWPDGQGIPALGEIVQGLAAEATRLHNEAKAEGAQE